MTGVPAGWRSRLDGVRLGAPGLVIAAVAILVLAWPIRSQFGRVTSDLSWQLGLHQAAADGLHFGREIVFTYGPLGFLASPVPFIGPTSALAFVVTAAIYLGVVALLLRASLRLFTTWVAALVTLAFARAIGWLEPFEALQILAFGLGVEVLRQEAIERSWRVAAIAGFLAGIAVLAKDNIGVVMIAMALVVVWAVSRPRVHGLMVLAVATTATTIGSWLASGQQLSDLVPYVRASEELLAGYSDAMGVSLGGAWFLYAAFLLVAAIVVALAYRMSAAWPRDRRLALAALVILLLFASWKSAFVRSHVGPTFATLAFATLILVPTNLPRRATAFALVAVAVAFLLAVQLPMTRYLDVVTSSIDFGRQTRDALMPWGWDATAERTRQRLRSEFHVPPSILAELEGHTVSIDPSAAAIASAYRAFTWQPMPVFQSYAAYTAELDRLNAERLRSATRPEMVLRAFQPRKVTGGLTVPYAIDERNYWFESPEATVERLCRYREVAVSGNFQVLADSGHECGAPTLLASVTAPIGESIAVPAATSPDDMVIVRVHGVGDGPLARLRSALWKTPPWHVTVDDVRYRLVPQTAEDGLVLAVPGAAQGSAPFAFGPPTRTIAIDGPGLGGPAELTYDFYAVPLPAS